MLNECLLPIRISSLLFKLELARKSPILKCSSKMSHYLKIRLLGQNILEDALIRHNKCFLQICSLLQTNVSFSSVPRGVFCGCLFIS